MSTRQVSDRNDPIIESRDMLVAPMQKGEKPPERWRIGTEHEKFVYRTEDRRAPSYAEPGGIRDLLMALTEYGWEPIMEGGNVIAMSGPDGAVSLEPAGQLELSGAPLENLHQTCAETGRHLAQEEQRLGRQHQHEIEPDPGRRPPAHARSPSCSPHSAGCRRGTPCVPQGCDIQPALP